MHEDLAGPVVRMRALLVIGSDFLGLNLAFIILF